MFQIFVVISVETKAYNKKAGSVAKMYQRNLLCLISSLAFWINNAKNVILIVLNSF